MPRPPSTRLARNLLLEGELLLVSRALARERIALVVLKGIPLARRLYGRLDARAMVDNDLLVHKADVRRAVAVLEKLGYEQREFHTLEGDLRVDFETTLRRRVSTSMVEADLHWNAFAPDLFDVGEDVLFGRTEDFELHGERLRVFDRSLTILHLAANFARNQLSDLQTLRDLGTAWSLWQGAIELDELASLARRSGTWHVLEFALSAAWDLGLTRSPPLRLGSRQARLLRQLLPASYLLTSRSRYDMAGRLVALTLVDPPRLPRRVRTMLFPRAETLAVIYGKPVSSTLYLRYLPRLFRPLKRALAGRRS